MTRRRAVGTAALAAVLLLAGCASAPAAAPATRSPTAGAPEPTPTFTPVLVPTPAFGGDCTEVLTDAQLDELLGQGWLTFASYIREVVPEEPLNHVPDLPSVATLGGIECDWVAEDMSQAPPAGIRVTILPAAEAPGDFGDRFSTPTCLTMYDYLRCGLAALSGDAWILATVPVLDELPGGVLENVIAEVSATIGTELGSVPVDFGQETTLLPDCEELGEAILMEELIGEGYKVGPYEGAPGPEAILLEEAGAELTCTYSTGPDRIEDRFDTIDAAFSAGGDWAWEDVAASEGAEVVELPGGGEGIIFRAEYPQTSYVFATDDRNLYRAGGAEVDLLLETVARMLPAMGD